MTAGPSRRTALGAFAALPWLAACGTPLPLGPRPANDASAAARLRESAEAHGLAAYRRVNDINVGYAGEWRPLIGRVQPELVDAGFRGGSQERLMPAAGVVAQSHTGPLGRKQVHWRRGSAEAGSSATGGSGGVAVWFNGTPSSDAVALDAAALVAECYGLFLLGPLWLHDRGLPVQAGGTQRVEDRLCDVVEVWLAPGLGRSALDRVALSIDRADGTMRRVRFTLEGTAGTRGAVAEVDTFDHRRRFGILWPMRSYERVVHPIALPAHDWRVTGLDIDRGYPVDALGGPAFVGAAAAPAAAL